MNTKKGLINPVLHEIRSPNPPPTRVSGLKYQNDYPKSIEGMAGVGYNRNSNDLRELNQQATTTAIGARSNPEYSTHRFTGLYGREALNQPQKYTSDFDSKMKQKIELLRHGNENRRFGKRKTMKKSSYENGIAGGGYSGEIIVTPKRGRPYKGQPNSLPLVSKRQKIKKDDWYNPSYTNGAAEAARIMDTGQISTLPYKRIKPLTDVPTPETQNLLNLVNLANPLGSTSQFMPEFQTAWADFANAPFMQYLAAAAAANRLSETAKITGFEKKPKPIDPNTFPFENALKTRGSQDKVPLILEGGIKEKLPWQWGKKGVPLVAYADKALNLPQEIYGYLSSAVNFPTAVGKEISYFTNGQPNFAPVKTTATNAPVKRFDQTGRAALMPNNFMPKVPEDDFMFPVYEWLANNLIPNTSNLEEKILTDKYLNRKPLTIAQEKEKFDSQLAEYLIANGKNPLHPYVKNWESAISEEGAPEFDQLPLRMQQELGRFGRPKLTRKTPWNLGAINEAILSQYLGSGNGYPAYFTNTFNNEDKKIAYWNAINTAFGDQSSNKGMTEAPQYTVQGWTPSGKKRVTGLSYVNQPDGMNMPAFDTSKNGFILQESENPLFNSGIDFLNQTTANYDRILNRQWPKPYDFYSAKNAMPGIVNHQGTDPGWMIGSQLSSTGPYAGENLKGVESMDNYKSTQNLKDAIKNSGLDFSKIPFSKRNTKKSATFTKSLYPTKDKYDNTEKAVAKLVNPSKNTNKYFK